MEQWPESLPSAREVLVDGYSETFSGDILRSDMDNGPATVRRRSSALVVPTTIRLLLTTDQVHTLRIFWQRTLEHGILPFEWDRPRDGEPIIARMASGLSISAAGSGELWSVTFTIDQMP